MFKEIKRKITLFNTLILVIFMFMFIFLLGFLVNWSLSLSGEMYLTTVAKEIIQNNGQTSSQPINSGDSVHDKFGYQFIMWDSSNIVKSMKVDDRNLIMMGYELSINKNETPQFNLLVSENIEYRVYTLPYSNNSNDYVLQVFQQISTERSIIAYVISFLFLIGIGSIAVLVPISYFLAGKSLQPIRDTFEDQKSLLPMLPMNYEPR